MSIPIIKYFYFVFGLIIGSFLNVVIYRVPQKKSIVRPRSLCTKCGYQIPWFQNIPLLSYIFLRGKCANCGTKIHWQYPLIELIAGLGAFWLGPMVLGPIKIAHFAIYYSVFCVFICHFVIDLKHKILPNSINLYLFGVLLTNALVFYNWKFWLLGGLIGFGFPLTVTYLFYLIRGQIGLGMGDIKLFGILGLYLGPIGILQNIFISCFVGSIVGLTLIGFKITKKSDAIAFGPSILFVAFFQIFFSNAFQYLMGQLI